MDFHVIVTLAVEGFHSRKVPFEDIIEMPENATEAEIYEIALQTAYAANDIPWGISDVSTLFYRAVPNDRNARRSTTELC